MFADARSERGAAAAHGIYVAVAASCRGRFLRRVRRFVFFTASDVLRQLRELLR